MILPANLPGFSIGGVHSSTFGIYLVSKSISLLPKTRDYELTIFGRSGIKDYGTDLDTRAIDLVLTMLGSNRSDLLTNMRNFAAAIDPRKGYQQLIFDDDTTRYFLAKYTTAGATPTANLVVNRATFPLGFKADDPFIYAVTPRSEHWQPAANGQLSLQNNGSIEAPMVLTIKPLNGGTLTNGVTITVNGIQIVYSGEILPTDVIEIDTKEFTVKKNGANSIRYWSGDFPSFQPGANTLVESDSGGLGADVTIAFTERWL